MQKREVLNCRRIRHFESNVVVETQICQLWGSITAHPSPCFSVLQVVLIDFPSSVWTRFLEFEPLFYFGIVVEFFSHFFYLVTEKKEIFNLGLVWTSPHLQRRARRCPLQSETTCAHMFWCRHTQGCTVFLYLVSCLNWKQCIEPTQPGLDLALSLILILFKSDFTLSLFHFNVFKENIFLVILICLYDVFMKHQ